MRHIRGAVFFGKKCPEFPKNRHYFGICCKFTVGHMSDQSKRPVVVKGDFGGWNRGFSGKTFRRLFLAGVVIVLMIAAAHYFQTRRPVTLNCLFIDLEYGLPDRERHKELREAFSKILIDQIPDLPRPEIRLHYKHFTQLSEVDTQAIDFIVLSPQGTPWYMYQGDAAVKLNSAKDFLKRQIIAENVPALGICGGHQFMAIAFGGNVDFIDSKFAGTFPKTYPKEAISERGIVQLETISDDPIFEGVTVHPGKLSVIQSHYEEVKSVPKPFVNIACSRLSENQLIRIPGKIAYGTAFHPERGWNHDPRVCEGKQLMANFIKMVLADRYAK